MPWSPDPSVACRSKRCLAAVSSCPRFAALPLSCADAGELACSRGVRCALVAALGHADRRDARAWPRCERFSDLLEVNWATAVGLTCGLSIPRRLIPQRMRPVFRGGAKKLKMFDNPTDVLLRALFAYVLTVWLMCILDSLDCS